MSVLLRELDAAPVTSRERIAVLCDDGIVTLTGTVRAKLAKDRASRVAQVVRGVRAVIDRIRVSPDTAQPHPDTALELDVAGVLGRDPVTARQPIAARARDGVLHLTGEVDSIASRRAAEGDALAVPGVRGVGDDLVVRRTRRGDDRLASEAERMLRDDPWVDGGHIHATAERGVVMLAGTTGSWAEKVRAEADVRATSPDDVSTAALAVVQSVDDGTRRSQSASGSAPAPTDAELAQTLVDTYARDPRLRSFLPEIDVRYGIVVLTGVAPTSEASNAAVEDARNVSGVTGARSNLRTSPETTVSDGAMLYSVRRAIDGDPGLAPRHLEVQVWRGRILMRGTVATPADRLHAIAIATSTPGARAVEDILMVAAPTLSRR